MAKSKAVGADAVAYNISGIRHLRVNVAGDKVRWLRFEGGRRYVEVVDESLLKEYEKVHKSAIPAEAKKAEVKEISKIEEKVEEVSEVAEEEESEDTSEEAEDKDSEE